MALRGRSFRPSRTIPNNTLVLSPYILGEVGKVLSYSPLSEKLGLSTEEVHRHLALLRAVARIVELPRTVPVVLNDPKDDPVLFTAIGGGAEVLCTRDRAFYDPHVLSFAKKHGMAIMDDLQLLSVLRG